MIAWPPFERRTDRLADTYRVVEDLSGRKPQDGETSAVQIVVTQRVVALCNASVVRVAIDFDDNLRMQAGEIDIVGSELHLLTEVIPVSAKRVQQSPHPHF